MREINWKYKIGEIIKDNKRDLTIIDKIYKKDGSGHNRKYYKILCNKCMFKSSYCYNVRNKLFELEYWVIENSLVKGTGCPCCCKNPQVVVKGINDIATTHPNLVKYFVDKEDAYTHTYASDDIISCKCPNCGKIKDIKLSNLYNKGFSCPTCSDNISYCEKLTINALAYLNIDFIYQYTKVNAKWCDKYKYDFYFEKDGQEYIIETHGNQHYDGGFNQSLKYIQENDTLKKELAIKNGIKEENYIVIDCRYSELEYIKNNMLNSKLNKILSINSIDWDECKRNCKKSMMVEIYNFHINNKNVLISDLSKKYKLDRHTISRYIKNISNIENTYLEAM